ncbi:hypothetical protein MMC28_006679 [Mycoblastus sanguinarius]|nr:hypothetical protein [Mycoblastus sanguinarius]
MNWNSENSNPPQNRMTEGLDIDFLNFHDHIGVDPQMILGRRLTSWNCPHGPFAHILFNLTDDLKLPIGSVIVRCNDAPIPDNNHLDPSDDQDLHLHLVFSQALEEALAPLRLSNYNSSSPSMKNSDLSKPAPKIEEIKWEWRRKLESDPLTSGNGPSVLQTCRVLGLKLENMSEMGWIEGKWIKARRVNRGSCLESPVEVIWANIVLDADHYKRTDSGLVENPDQSNGEQ